MVFSLIAVLLFATDDAAMAYVQAPVLIYVLVVELLGLLLVWQDKDPLPKRKSYEKRTKQRAALLYIA